MNYTITKEQVLELSETSYSAKQYLKELFPDAFKTELQVGKWYNSDYGLLFQFNGKYSRSGDSESFGFTKSGIWKENIGVALDGADTYREATEEEVSAALIAEAKKRGFKIGVTILRGEWYAGFSAPKTKIEKDYYPKNGFEFCGNTLSLKGYTLFYSGKWAEIIPEEKKVITKDKALKILAKKYKTTPENITISE